MCGNWSIRRAIGCTRVSGDRRRKLEQNERKKISKTIWILYNKTTSTREGEDDEAGVEQSEDVSSAQVVAADGGGTDSRGFSDTTPCIMFA
jgi:hypothetical protein